MKVLYALGRDDRHRLINNKYVTKHADDGTGCPVCCSGVDRYQWRASEGKVTCIQCKNILSSQVPDLAFPCRQSPAGWVYLIGTEGMERYQVGCAVWLSQRFAEIQIGSPTPLCFIHGIDCVDAGATQRFMHNRFIQYWSHGEWFDLPPDEVKWFCSLRTF